MNKKGQGNEVKLEALSVALGQLGGGGTISAHSHTLW